MYSEADFARAAQIARRQKGIFLSTLVLAAVMYIILVWMGSRTGMMLVLLAAFLFAVFYGDLKLLPVLRWEKFLREMKVGLRRNLVCRVDARETEPQMQDGLRVFAQQVCLPDGDTRIFYLNADHTNRFPEQGSCIRLESYGRHITGFEILAGEAETC